MGKSVRNKDVPNDVLEAFGEANNLSVPDEVLMAFGEKKKTSNTSSSNVGIGSYPSSSLLTSAGGNIVAPTTTAKKSKNGSIQEQAASAISVAVGADKNNAANVSAGIYNTLVNSVSRLAGGIAVTATNIAKQSNPAMNAAMSEVEAKYNKSLDFEARKISTEFVDQARSSLSTKVDEEARSQFDIMDGNLSTKDIKALAFQAPSQLADMVVGAYTAGSSFFVQSVNDSAKELEENPNAKNLSEGEKIGYLLTQASVQAALEKFSVDKILKGTGITQKVTKKIAGEVIEELVEKGTKATAKQVEDAVFRKVSSMASKIRQSGVKTATGFAVESSTEALQSGASDGLKLLSNKVAGAEIFNEEDITENFLKNMINAGAQGGVFGGVLGGGASTLSNTNKAIRSEIAKVQSPQDVEAVKQQINEQLELGNITPTEAAASNIKVEQYAEMAAKIPSEVSETQKYALIGGIEQRESIKTDMERVQSEMTNLDPAFHAEKATQLSLLGAKLGQVNDYLEEIVSGEKTNYIEREGKFYKVTPNGEVEIKKAHYDLAKETAEIISPTPSYIIGGKAVTKDEMIAAINNNEKPDEQRVIIGDAEVEALLKEKGTKVIIGQPATNETKETNIADGTGTTNTTEVTEPITTTATEATASNEPITTEESVVAESKAIVPTEVGTEEATTTVTEILATEGDKVKLASKIGGENEYTFHQGEWKYKDSRDKWQSLASKEKVAVEEAWNTMNGIKKSETPTATQTDTAISLLPENSPSLRGMTPEQSVQFIAQQAQSISEDGTPLEGDNYQSTVNTFGEPLVKAAIEAYPKREGVANSIETDNAIMKGNRSTQVEINDEQVLLPEEGFVISDVTLKDGVEKGKGNGQQIYTKALDEHGTLYSFFPVSEDAMRVQDKLVEKGVATIENVTLSDGTEVRKITKTTPTVEANTTKPNTVEDDTKKTNTADKVDTKESAGVVDDKANVQGKTKESGSENVVRTDTKEGFTEVADLNRMYANAKAKYGEKKGIAIYQAASRLVNPNENTIVDIKSNGVTVKEGDKYIFRPFGNTDANSKKWTLYKGLDVTNQWVKPNSEQTVQVSDTTKVEKTTKADTKKTTPTKEAKEKSSVEKLAQSVEEKGVNVAMAEWLRSKKLKGGTMVTVDFGLTKEIYNGAVEFIAKQVEKGTKLGNALAEAMKRIDKAMGGSKWDKGGFGKEMSKTFTMQLNGKEEVVQRDDTKETAEVINGFYSPLEQRILDVKEDNLPANKWLERLNTEEAKWTGVADFLTSKGKEKVSKQELKTFMRDNRIEIVEVVKDVSEAKMISSDEENTLTDAIMDDYEYFGMSSVFDAKEAIAKNEDWAVKFNVTDKKIIRLGNKYRESTNSTKGGKPKYETYQLAGEKSNYKEVLVTLPASTQLSVKELKQMQQLEAIRPMNRVPSETRRLQELYDKVPNATKNVFRSSHFDEPNILVHLRFSTRIDADGRRILMADELQSDYAQKGRKEGFKVEKAEVEPQLKRISKELNDKYGIIVAEGASNHYHFEVLRDWDKQWIWVDDAAVVDVPNEDARMLIKEYKDRMAETEKSTLSPAPFVTDTNSWVKLGLKYLLKHGVDENVDRIAWVNGQQSNERYDLSNTLESVDVSVSGNDRLVYIRAKNNSDGAYKVDEKGIVVDSGRNNLTGNVDGKRLDDIIGKELAEKVMAAKNGDKLSGDDFKIGGKGMIGFYGNPSEGKEGIVGGVAKALIKDLTGVDGQIVGTEIQTNAKYDDAKVVELEREIYKLEQKQNNVRNNKEYNEYEKAIEERREKLHRLKFGGLSAQHSIEITPELKASVKQGMPLFGEAKTQSKLLSLADKIEKNGLDYTLFGFGKKDSNIKLMGADFDKLFADLLRAIDAGAKTIEQAWKSIGDYYNSNKIANDERIAKDDFFGFVNDNVPPKSGDTDVEGEGGGMVGVTHAAMDALAEELGLPDKYEKNPEEVSQWDAEAKQRIADGKMPDLISKIEKQMIADKADIVITEVEQRMILQYVAGLKAEYDANGEMSVLKEFQRIKKLNDAVGSSWGRMGRARQDQMPPNPIEGGLASAMVAKAEANNVDVDMLTEKQKSEVEKQVEEYKKAAELAEAKAKELKEAYDKLKAEKEIRKAKVTNQAGTPKTKEQRAKEKADIIQSIKDKWKKASNDNIVTAVPIPYAKQLVAIAPDVAKLMKVLVEEGADKLGDIVKQIHGYVRGAVPEVTEKDVQDIIAGVYNEKKTRSELSAQITDLRNEAKLLIELERVMNSEAKTESKQRAKNQRLTEIRKQIEKLKKDNKLDQYSDLAKLQKAIDANKKKEEEYIKRIADKDFAPEKPTPLQENFELKNRFPKLYKETMDAMFSKDKAKAEYEAALYRDAMKKEDGYQKTGRFFRRLGDTVKELTASFDDSMAFVQLYFTLINNPTTSVNFREYTDANGKKRFAVGGAIKEHVLDAISSKRFDRSLSELHNSPYWDLIEASKLDVLDPKSLHSNKVEETFGRGGFSYLVGTPKYNFKTLSNIFNRAFTSLGNNVRVSMFLKGAEKLQQKGITFEDSPQEYKDLAKAINNLTGRGSINKNVVGFVTHPVITSFIWTPRMLASSLNIIGASEVMGKVGFYQGITGKARVYAIKQISEQIGIGVGMMALVAMSKVLGAGDDDEVEVHYDPRDNQFGDIQIGNKAVNVFGRYASPIKLIVQMMPYVGGEIQKDGTVKSIYEEGGKTGIKEVGGFFRGKFTPQAGVIYDYVLNERKNFFTKEKMTVKNTVRSVVTPMALREVAANLERDGSISLLTQFIPSFLGLNVKDQRDFKGNKAIEFTPEQINSNPTLKILQDKKVQLSTPAFERIEIRDAATKTEVPLSEYSDEQKKDYEKARLDGFMKYLKVAKQGVYIDEYTGTARLKYNIKGEKQSEKGDKSKEFNTYDYPEGRKEEKLENLTKEQLQELTNYLYGQSGKKAKDYFENKYPKNTNPKKSD